MEVMDLHFSIQLTTKKTVFLSSFNKDILVNDYPIIKCFVDIILMLIGNLVSRLWFQTGDFAGNKSSVLNEYWSIVKKEGSSVLLLCHLPNFLFQFAYNFERVWYLCCGRDGAMIENMMNEVENKGKTNIPSPVVEEVGL